MLPTDRAEGWLLRGVMPSACLLLAIVKPQRGEKGKIRFTAKVPGLPEQSLTLKVIRWFRPSDLRLQSITRSLHLM